MLRLEAERGVSFCDGLTRRDFLHAGSLATLGLTLPGWMAQKAAGAVADRDINCIMLFLVGGPSHIDTWDPKPKAPAEVRGPFQPIATCVPGMQVSEIFPRLARLADKFSLVRSVYHTATAVHDTGHQMMQTGRLFSGGIEHPHVGCVLGYLKGRRGEVPAHVLIPRPMGRTGGNMPHGQTRFGQSCLLARRLIERGVRFVTINMFETVFDEITWDIHGSRPFTDITEMARLVAPNFDRAYSALLEDLHERGLLASTIVTAMGEFGRTPKINPAGGRDHHPGVWTILMGGGPIKGGRVVGESDALGYIPKTRPVTPGEVAATLV